MRSARSVAAGAAAWLAVSAPAVARAYCRTSACGDLDGTVCTPASPTDCGIPIAWPTSCVGFSIQEDASTQITLEETKDALERAFATWESADCGGNATPHIRARYMGTAACALHEYNQRAGNANVVVYRDDDWPHPHKEDVALTTVTYNPDTGEIDDADIEINTHLFRITVDGANGTYDLQSVVTHETGHFLGLAHSPSPGATMVKSYPAGVTWLRDLTADDVAGICAVYPPDGPVDEECAPEIKHGYSPLCAADQPSAGEPGCTCSAPGGGAGSLAAPWLAAALSALCRARRRRQGQ